MSRLEIADKSGCSASGSVRLDGHDISHALRGLRLNMMVGELNIAELDVDVVAVELTSVDAEVKAHIPADTHDLLVRLGWTPPEET